MADLGIITWFKDNSKKAFFINPFIAVAAVIVLGLILWGLWANMSPYL